MISKQILEDVRQANDIVDVVGSCIPVKRAGTTFRALCPFHKEKTPSFHVNPQRQIFHCFGCGAGGDVFGFIMRYEGVDFSTAVRMLAQRAGLRLEFEDEQEHDDRTALYEVNAEAARFFRRCLEQMAAAEPARAYLKKRGLPPDILESFNVGYAPNRWDAILQWGARKKFDVERLEKAGLIVKSTKPESRVSHYDRFRNRVMFPICDAMGRVVAFSGRALTADEPAKYVNSPETPLFVKSRILYALDKARRRIADAGEAILCEGQIDVIRCHQHGFDTAVASQGTAFTEAHAAIIKRYADGIVILLDSDNAGQEAAMKSAALCIRAGLSVRVAALPPGEDPDSFLLANGPDAFKAILGKATSCIAFQVAVLSAREDLSTELGRMRVTRATLETVAASASPVQRASMLSELSELVRLPVADLGAELARIKQPPQRNEQAPRAAPTPAGAPSQPSPAAPPQPCLEEALLCELLALSEGNPEPAGIVAKHLPTAQITHPACRAFVESAIQAAKTGSSIQDLLLQRDDYSPEIQAFAARVQSAPQRARGSEFGVTDSLRDQILRIWTRTLRTERDSLSPADAERRAQLTYDMSALRRWETGVHVIELEMQ